MKTLGIDGRRSVVLAPWTPDEHGSRILASEEACIRIMEPARWPGGVICPKCLCDSTARVVYRGRPRGTHRCRRCYAMFSWRTGWVGTDSRLPARDWIISACMVSRLSGFGAGRVVRRAIGRNHHTSWYLTKRLREARDECTRIAFLMDIHEAARTWPLDPDTAYGKAKFVPHPNLDVESFAQMSGAFAGYIERNG